MKKTFVMWLMGACAMSCLTVSAQTAASAIESKKQTLYSSENHWSTPYRIPAVATLNNGGVLAIADQRPCGADVGNGEVDIYAKVGTIAANGAYSWNPADTDPSTNGGLKIADGTSSNGYGDAAVVVDRESGKVLVITVAGKVVFSSGSSSKHNKMARIIGSADGLTWESPQDVTTTFFDNLLPSAYTMFMASGRMVQSQHVKVGDYYRIYGVLLVREKSGWFSKSNNNYVVYSDDFGASWNVLGGTYCLKGGDEAKVEELPNGDLVMSSRTSGGRYYNVFNFSNLQSASGSWGSATKCSFSGSNSTNGELMLYKGVTDANGTEYNVMLQSLPTGSSRSNVSVYYKAFATSKSSWAVSDFTSGWTKGIEVDNGASGYSTMTILANGEVGFLYEDDYSTSAADGDAANIVYVPLTVSEITGGAYTYTNETVEPEPEPEPEPVNPELSLSQTTVTLTEGETAQLTLTTNSDGAVTYVSSNTAVATVNNNGVVTAVAAGTATITANVAATETYNAASATCAVTVEAVVIEPVAPELSLSQTTVTLTEGETTQFTLTTNSDGAVTYVSSNTAVATVNNNGVVTAVAAGTATITANVAATETYNAASATCAVTVEAAPVEPEEPETPVEPEEPETPEIDAALQQAIADAKAVEAYSGVGYPSATAATRTALATAIANAEAGNATADDLAAAVSNFKNETTEIQMPEEGKTYTFANVAKDGTKRYFNYASSGITAVTDAASATEFTCEVIADGEYAFVTAEGKYLIWKGPNGTEGFWLWKKTYGYNDNKGYVDSYNSTYCDLVVEKLTTGDNVEADSDAALFGLMCIKGMRYSRNAYGYFTLTGSTFDASADPYYNSTYSSAFLIEDTGAAAKARTRDAETTDIEEVETEVAPATTEHIYDLMGRRVTEMKPGQIYIVNGKKQLIVER